MKLLDFLPGLPLDIDLHAVCLVGPFASATSTCLASLAFQPLSAAGGGFYFAPALERAVLGTCRHFQMFVPSAAISPFPGLLG